MSPTSPPRLCPRCGATIKGRCPTCSSGWATGATSTKWKPGTYSRARWDRFRKAYLRDHPMCAWPGCHDLAVQVDHLDGTDYDVDRYNRAKVRGLCEPHHRERTTRQSHASRAASKGEGRSDP